MIHAREVMNVIEVYLPMNYALHTSSRSKLSCSSHGGGARCILGREPQWEMTILFCVIGSPLICLLTIVLLLSYHLLESYLSLIITFGDSRLLYAVQKLG